MTLGENIVRLRTQRNWSQGDLADALDISRQSVSKWETDASVPELEKLLKLSELFGVTLDALVRGEDAPQSEPAAAEVQNDPSSFVPQTVPARDKSRSIIGTVLLCTGAVIVLLFLCCLAVFSRGFFSARRFSSAVSSALRRRAVSVSGAAGRSMPALTSTSASRPAFHGRPSS